MVPLVPVRAEPRHEEQGADVVIIGGGLGGYAWPTAVSHDFGAGRPATGTTGCDDRTCRMDWWSVDFPGRTTG